MVLSANKSTNASGSFFDYGDARQCRQKFKLSEFSSKASNHIKMENPVSADLPSEVRFQGNVSQKQFSLVQQALLPRWMRMYVAAPLFTYVFAFRDADWATLIAHPISVLPGLMTAMAAVLAYWGLLAYGRKQAWRNAVQFNGEISGRVSDFGIEWNTALNSSRFPWSKLTKVSRISNITLVFYSSRCAFYFPREFFSSDEQWAKLEEILSSKLPK